jgi:glycosyltransferase involved in cell wall biosynthesis
LKKIDLNNDVSEYSSQLTKAKSVLKNAIIVDYNPPSNWDFHKAIEEATNEKWVVERFVSNEHGGLLKKIKRYIKYFEVPFKIFKKRKNYKNLLAWQQFYGLLFAFYLRFFKVSYAPDVIVMTFIYKPKKGFVGYVYKKFMRYVLTSGYIKKIVVFSESEKVYYAKLFGLSKDMFIAEKLGIDDEIYETEKGYYYLSAGRSNRDYGFLTSAWSNNRFLKIICDVCKDESTDNIQYLTNCHDENYYEYLAKCKAVIIPLKDEKISSGQLVLIQAMMFGKPVIVTENDTVHDYITDGVNGFIIEKNSVQLDAVLEKLDNEAVYEELSVNARKTYVEQFTVYAMGKRIGKHISEKK